MTPAQLRSFLAVARTGSVRAAAGELVVTQPAVSAAVAALARELGTPLFARHGRGVVITPAGQVLADYGARILGLWDEAQVASRAAADPSRGTLRLAAVTTAGEQVVPATLASFRRLHPGVEIVIEVGNRRRVWELLRTHGVDVAVGGRPPAGSDLSSVGSAPYELVVVAAATGRSEPAARQVSVSAMASRTWLVREAGSGTLSTTEELFGELGIEPSRLTIGSNGAIREAAAAGLGLALLSRSAVTRELAEGRLEEWVAGPLPLQRTWNLVVRRGDRLVPAAASYCDHLGRGGSGWRVGKMADAGAR